MNDRAFLFCAAKDGGWKRHGGNATGNEWKVNASSEGKTYRNVGEKEDRRMEDKRMKAQRNPATRSLRSLRPLWFKLEHARNSQPSWHRTLRIMRWRAQDVADATESLRAVACIRFALVWAMIRSLWLMVSRQCSRGRSPNA
jgi:hypothetical protein